MENTNSTPNGMFLNKQMEAVNLVSGAYTSPLIDQLSMLCNEDDSIQGFYHAILAMYEEGRTIEAMQLIRALFDVSDMSYPDEMALLEEDETTRMILVSEIISDFNDILYQSKAE